MDSTVAATLISSIASILGGVGGALITWFAMTRASEQSDRRTESRERRLEDERFRRAVLAERLVAQRDAITIVKKLSAECAHSMTHEVEFGALEVRLNVAFGSPNFAAQVVAALDESCEAAKGSPSPNAGLCVVACLAVMETLVTKVMSDIRVSGVEYEDPMPHHELALLREKEAFGGLWSTGDSSLDSREEKTALARRGGNDESERGQPGE